MSKNNEKTVFVVRIDTWVTTLKKKHWWHLSESFSEPEYCGSQCIAVCDTIDKCYEKIQEHVRKYKDNMKNLGIVMNTSQEVIDELVNNKSTQIPVTWIDTRNGITKFTRHYYEIFETPRYE